MNAKRNIPAPHGVKLGAIAWIIVFIAILSSTGVTCGLLENQRIKIGRQIRDEEKKIQMHQNDRDAAQAKINNYLGFFEIKGKLASTHSTLIPLKHGQVEVIRETDLKRAASSFASR